MARPPPLESLRVLEACVRLGSFTRAAGELAVTPAAVSLRVRDLEAELGVVLFHRSGPRLAATPTALALAEGVADGLGRIRAAVEAARGDAAPLRITTPPSFGARWLAPRLARYDAAPIELDASAELRETFDVGVRTGVGPWPGWASAPLFPVDATPMLAPALAAAVRTPAHLAAIPLIPHDDWPRWFAAAGVSPLALRFHGVAYPTHELDAEAALAGLGAALLSPIVFAELLASGRLVRPFETVLSGPAAHHVLWRDGAGSRAASFVRWLRAEAARI